MKFRISAIVLVVSLAFFSCSKLNETFNDSLPDLSTGGSIPLDALLKSVYTSMHTTFQDNANAWPLEEMTTDDMIGPTRGPDWDDNGAWRVLHNQNWDGTNIHIQDVFNQLLATTYAATDLLRFNPSAQQAAEARYLRAFASYMVLDGWDQVPYRDPGENTLQPSRVRVGLDALNYIIGEVNAVIKDLPEEGQVLTDGTTTRGRANKDAARVLLMKCYLNKAVYTNRTAATYNFDVADMNHVIALADTIITSGRYSLAVNYFDNFAPSNTAIGTENIWTQENVGGVPYGGDGNSVRSRWHAVMHYNQNPGGWNGFSTLSSFYDKFEDSDKRRGVAYPTAGASNPGNRVNVGMLIGQQYDWTNDKQLTDRAGLPLVFTKEVSSIELGSNLEVTGVRVNKYPIDYTNDGSGNVDNDYPYFRLSDVLLMKAEAIMRGGAGTAAGSYGGSALEIVNALRTHPSRGASALTTLTEDQLIDERGRELYWEGWRRQDLIRFHKFLTPFDNKAQTSADTYLLFAIPNQQISVNPNLVQNPGYSQ